MTVLDFAKFLLTLNPEGNAARLSLYHFVKNTTLGSENFSPELINRFFARAYSFPHWQEHRNELRGEVLAVLESFLKTQKLDWSSHRLDSELQVVRVEKQTDLYEIIKTYWSRKRTEGEKLRLLPDGEESLVLLRLQQDGSLFIHSYEPLVTFREGVVAPLNDDLVIKYGPQLEPALGHTQMLMVQPGVFAQFRLVESHGVQGRLIRGYTFNRMEEIQEAGLNRIPVLFYPMKRLERFFINRATDPLYMELTQLLDQSIILLREGHPEGHQLASAALERGQNALSYIFTDDKVLSVLLRELSSLLFEKTYVGERNGQGPTQ